MNKNELTILRSQLIILTLRKIPGFRKFCIDLVYRQSPMDVFYSKLEYFHLIGLKGYEEFGEEM